MGVNARRIAERRFVVALAGVLLIPAGAAAEAAVPHDDIADARAVQLIPFVDRVATVGAGLEEGEPVPSCGPTHEGSVWFSFIAPAEPVDVSTAGTRAGETLTIYAGGPPDLTEIACAWEPNEDQPRRARVSPPAGSSVYVRVGTAPLEYLVTLGITLAEPSSVRAGDDWNAPIEVSALPFATTIDTKGFGFDDGEFAPCGDGSRGGTAWLRLAAPTNEGMMVRVRSGVPSFFEVAKGASAPTRERIACGWFYSDPWGDILGTVRARPGETVWLQVGTADGEPGPVRVTVEPAVVPANDDFGDALPVSIPFELTAEHGAASVEPGEGDGDACGNVSATQWYRFTAADALPLMVQVSGGARYTIWEGTSLHDRRALRPCENPSSWTHVVEPGLTYYIQVDAPEPGGSFRLRGARGAAVESFPLVARATEDGRLEGSAGGFFVRPAWEVDAGLDDGAEPRACVGTSPPPRTCLP